MLLNIRHPMDDAKCYEREGIHPNMYYFLWSQDFLEASSLSWAILVQKQITRKQLMAEGITGDCEGGKYRPENKVAWAKMAVFLVRTFNLSWGVQ